MRWWATAAFGVCLALTSACAGLLGFERAELTADESETPDASRTPEASDGTLALVLTPARARVTRGRAVEVQVEVRRPAGASELVSLRIDDLPTGTTSERAIVPASETRATLTIQASPEAKGSGRARVNAVSVSGRWTGSATLDLEVVPPPGTPDPSFGDKGIVRLFEALEAGSTRATSIALHVTADRKLATSTLVFEAKASTTVRRLLEDGTLDPSFSTTKVSDISADQVVVQPDGRTLLAPMLARLAAAGGRDPTFATTATGYVTVLPDGKLLVSRTSEIRRLGSNGTPDGFVFEAIPADIAGVTSVASVVRLPDGSVVWCGLTTDHVEGLVVRYRADGSLDRAFGAGGLLTPSSPCGVVSTTSDGSVVFGTTDGVTHVVTATGSPAPLATAVSPRTANAVAIQDDGKLLVLDFNRLTRFLPTGQVDTSFGTNGVVAFDATTAWSVLELDGRGGLYVGGIPKTPTKAYEMLVTRLFL